MLKLIDKDNRFENTFVCSSEICLFQKFRQRVYKLVSFRELKITFVKSFILNVFIYLFFKDWVNIYVIVFISCHHSFENNLIMADFMGWCSKLWENVIKLTDVETKDDRSKDNQNTYYNGLLPVSAWNVSKPNSRNDNSSPIIRNSIINIPFWPIYAVFHDPTMLSIKVTNPH